MSGPSRKLSGQLAGQQPGFVYRVAAENPDTLLASVLRRARRTAGTHLLAAEFLRLHDLVTSGVLPTRWVPPEDRAEPPPRPVQDVPLTLEEAIAGHVAALRGDARLLRDAARHRARHRELGADPDWNLAAGLESCAGELDDLLARWRRGVDGGAD